MFYLNLTPLATGWLLKLGEHEKRTHNHKIPSRSHQSPFPFHSLFGRITKGLEAIGCCSLVSASIFSSAPENVTQLPTLSTALPKRNQFVGF